MLRIFALALVTAFGMMAGPAKKVTQHTASKSASSVKTAGAKRAASTQHARSTHRARVRKPPAPSYQLHPDPERYAQIQRALSERGYFKGQANGTWEDDSADALKRFQADQKIDNDGKLDAHTLTALGLGPKHDGTSATGVPIAPASADAPQ